MRPFLIRWGVTAFAVFVTAPIVHIQYDGFGCLLAASLLLGIMNAVVRPILLLLSLPFIVVTLGFFILIINAFMLKIVSALIPCFQVGSMGSAFFGAILISFVSWLVSAFFRDTNGRIHPISRISRDPGMKQAKGRVIE